MSARRQYIHVLVPVIDNQIYACYANSWSYLSRFIHQDM